ncbi:MAG TPA: mannosyltransferase family protein [Opitutaceae bacterium]|nr:mannosyltransferase family protein [Opitutaceae bacterium]
MPTIPDPTGANEPAEPKLNVGSLLVLFVSSRLLIYLTAGLSLLGVRKAEGFLPPRTVLDWFLRWDALWYLDVAEHGYHFAHPGDPTTNVGYFPLYPWLMRLVSLNGVLDRRAAGYVVSFVGFWLACVLLWRLVAREWRDQRIARWAVTFLVFSPISFFFTSLYSESWFLPLSIGCLLAARRRRWWLAGIFGALAAFTRIVGVALVVPLAWEALLAMREEGGWRWPRLSEILGSAMPVLGILAYAAVMWATFGNPFMYSQAQIDSGRHFTWFWGLFARSSFTGLSLFYRWWFAGTVVISLLALAAGVLLRMRTTYIVYALTFGFIYISARFIDSVPRYFGVLFPLYIVAALLVVRWPRLATPLLALSVILQTLSVILFVNGYWFT